ncbi:MULTISPECIES: hypothetical protein [unclassified Nocardiopsis]|uniref:hypothetical protein n=1 Tax=unclassified Nocardiopsis TaxID=2649073 RepID=UPI00135989D6|nr:MULTISPECIES: hypothetical protein [unclassified Nocardiopsis]
MKPLITGESLSRKAIETMLAATTEQQGYWEPMAAILVGHVNKGLKDLGVGLSWDRDRSAIVGPADTTLPENALEIVEDLIVAGYEASLKVVPDNA